MAVGAMNDEGDTEKTGAKTRSFDGVAGEGAPRSREPRSAGAGDAGDRARAGAMEVVVSHNIEKAMKILKRKLIKEGIFKELKARKYYEKPSERRKRKEKESRKKQRKEEARLRKGPGLL